MELKFFIDPETGQPHIHNHGVTESEVRHILARPGLVLKGPGVFVITAYELHGKELKAYRRRKRRRSK